MSSIILLSDADLDAVCGGILNGGAGGDGGAGGNGGTATTGNGVGGKVSGDKNNFPSGDQSASANGGNGGNGAPGGSLYIRLRLTA